MSKPTQEERERASKIIYALLEVVSFGPVDAVEGAHDQAERFLDENTPGWRDCIHVPREEWEWTELALEYVEHDKNCILLACEAGRPTDDGGYERKYRGMWYRVWYRGTPVDETPKCNCGLDDVLARMRESTRPLRRGKERTKWD